MNNSNLLLHPIYTLLCHLCFHSMEPALWDKILKQINAAQTTHTHTHTHHRPPSHTYIKMLPSVHQDTWLENWFPIKTIPTPTPFPFAPPSNFHEVLSDFICEHEQNTGDHHYYHKHYYHILHFTMFLNDNCWNIALHYVLLHWTSKSILGHLYACPCSLSPAPPPP